MALRVVQKGAVVVAHWSSIQKLLSGPTQIHENAIIVEIPDRASHSQRMAYYEMARKIVQAAKQ